MNAERCLPGGLKLLLVLVLYAGRTACQEVPPDDVIAQVKSQILEVNELPAQAKPSSPEEKAKYATVGSNGEATPWYATGKGDSKAEACMKRGDFSGAADRYRILLEGEGGKTNVHAMQNLAHALSAMRKHSEAEFWLREAWESVDDLELPARQLQLEKAGIALRLGKKLKELNRRKEAWEMYVNCLKGFGVDVDEETYDVADNPLPTDPDVPKGDLGDALTGIAYFLMVDKKIEDQGIKLFSLALPLHREARGDDHFDTLTTMANLANAYFKAGYASTAELYARRAWQGYQQVLGPHHQVTKNLEHNMRLYGAESVRQGTGDMWKGSEKWGWGTHPTK